MVPMRFDILNRLGVDHECDGQIDRTAVSNSAVERSALKIVTVYTEALLHYRCCGHGKISTRCYSQLVVDNAQENT